MWKVREKCDKKNGLALFFRGKKFDPKCGSNWICSREKRKKNERKEGRTEKEHTKLCKSKGTCKFLVAFHLCANELSFHRFFFVFSFSFFVVASFHFVIHTHKTRKSQNACTFLPIIFYLFIYIFQLIGQFQEQLKVTRPIYTCTCSIIAGLRT